MSQEPERVTLFGAKDREGRIYLVDDRAHIPQEVTQCQEFTIAPDRVEWSILSVEVEELRGIPITIQVGDYVYATPPPSKM